MRMISALAGLLAMSPALAIAQSSAVCDRQGGFVCSPAKAAWLGKTTGDVVILSSASVASAVDGAAIGTSLVENDRVIARDGSAVVDLGPDCLVDVPKRFSALVYRPDAARICVSVSELSPPPAQPAPAPAASFSVSPILYGVGAIGVAGGIAAVALGKGKQSSPVSGH